MLFKKNINKEPLVIFLDVDGVLNKESDWKTPFTLNNSCILVFNKLWKKLSIYYILKLIIISTWRSGKGELENSKPYTHLKNTLSKYNIKISDTTPISNKDRQNEVEYYIRRNNVNKYIIIDDDEKLFERPGDINWYQPNFKTGLIDADIKQIIKKIKKHKT